MFQLLKTDGARRLYEAARELPIIDFHNHISVADIASNRKYADLSEIWLAPDPYKHRLMRICGVPEEFITGSASGKEKFRKFCEIFPYTAGNPVFDWSRAELKEIFGIDAIPSGENADYIFNQASELLASPEYSTCGIFDRFRVAYQSPVAALTDDLSGFNGKTVAPSLRGDNLLLPDGALLAQLGNPAALADYFAALAPYLAAFEASGCRFADHALDDGFRWLPDDGRNEARFAALAAGEALTAMDAMALKSGILTELGSLYAQRGWTLLLHMDAKRKTSSRLLKLAGAAGGYAAVGGSFDVSALCDLLGAMEETEGGLPDTVLFPLNLSDQPALAVLQGSFSQDNVPSKVQLGPAWWWCDHRHGMTESFENIASFGVLSQFIGMTTDSRSILSFLRHDYFRQVLCAWLDEKAHSWDIPYSLQEEIVRKICYENALAKVERK